MKIRAADNLDKPKIIQLVKTVLLEFGFDYAPETSEADLQNLEEHYHDGAFLIMEDEEQELMATGALKCIGEGYFKVRKMYVAKKYRGKGYGKKILVKLIEIAQSNGATTLILETSKAMISAQNLYKSFGFRIVNLRPESPRCDITMIRKMDDESIFQK